MNSLTNDIATAINNGAFGSDYSARVWSKEGVADRVYVTVGRKDHGYVVVTDGSYDVAALRLPSSAHGKARGWLDAELAKVSA